MNWELEIPTFPLLSSVGYHGAFLRHESRTPQSSIMVDSIDLLLYILAPSEKSFRSLEIMWNPSFSPRMPNQQTVTVETKDVCPGDQENP